MHASFASITHITTTSSAGELPLYSRHKIPIYAYCLERKKNHNLYFIRQKAMLYHNAPPNGEHKIPQPMIYVRG